MQEGQGTIVITKESTEGIASAALALVENKLSKYKFSYTHSCYLSLSLSPAITSTSSTDESPTPHINMYSSEGRPLHV